MDGVYNWVSNIVFYLIFMTVINNLLPNKKYERYLKLFAGMILILLVLKPLTSSLRLEDQIAYYFESITFQNESEDLKREILGMEHQRLNQMLSQYEEAVGKDVEAMAEQLGFYPRATEITIEANQENPKFGTVTYIWMLVSRTPEVEETKVETIKAVEPVQVGKEKKKESVVPDEELNRLRRKVEEYYGLQTADVEIQVEK